MAVLQARPARELSHLANPGLIPAKQAWAMSFGLRVRATTDEQRLNSWLWLPTGRTSAQVGQCWISDAIHGSAACGDGNEGHDRIIVCVQGLGRSQRESAPERDPLEGSDHRTHGVIV